MSSSTRLRIILLILPAIIAGALYLGYPALARAGFSPVDIWVRFAADNMQRKLPQRLNRDVTWETVEAEGKTIIFVYRLNVAQNTSALRAYLDDTRRMVTLNICRKKSIRMAMRLGARISFRFRNARNHALSRIDLDTASCRDG